MNTKISWKDLYNAEDQDEAEAALKVFQDHYEDKYWDDFCSMVYIGNSMQDVDDQIWEEFLEFSGCPEHIQMYLDEEKVIGDYKIDWTIYDVVTSNGYTRYIAWRSF